jgi:hypothetical protein
VGCARFAGDAHEADQGIGQRQVRFSSWTIETAHLRSLHVCDASQGAMDPTHAGMTLYYGSVHTDATLYRGQQVSSMEDASNWAREAARLSIKEGEGKFEKGGERKER